MGGAGIAALMLFLLASGLGAGGASALVVQLPNGHRVGVTLRHGVARASISAPQASAAPATGDNGNMGYHGGPVLHSSAPYLIFWDPTSALPKATEAHRLERYFGDVAHDSGLATNDYGVLRQYSDRAGIADYAQTFSAATQVISDPNPYPSPNCPSTNSYYTICLTDAQLQNELTNVITANSLPTDGSTSAGEFAPGAPLYFIVTPANVNICLSVSPTRNCANHNFCSYHNYYNDAGNYVLYASIPLLGAESTDPNISPKLCQSDGNQVVQQPGGDGADVAIKYMIHEHAELITDPLLNAWFDNATAQPCTTNQPCNEVGDNCNAYAATADPVNGVSPNAFAPTLGGTVAGGNLYNQVDNTTGYYYVQSMWSDGDVSCELRAVPATMTPSFAAPSGNQAVGTPVRFDPSASSSSAGYTSVAWSFGDGTTSFASSAATGNPAPAPVSHVYSAPGTYTVTLTLVDTKGNLASANGTVTVRFAPVSLFTAAPADPVVGTAVSFDGTGSSDANSGGSINSYTWSFGDGTTGGGPNPSHSYAAPGQYTVTLTVTDDFGLTSSPSTVRLQALGTPTASLAFTPSAPASGHAVRFAGGGSTDPNDGGTISSYAWSFGDGGTGKGATISHTYPLPGLYIAKLTVTDSFGLSTSASHVVIVREAGKPVASHGLLSGVGQGRPKLSFKLVAGTNAPALEKVVIGLPAGFAFSKSGLAKGLSVKGALRATGKLTHGNLKITLSRAAREIRIGIALPAITVTTAFEHTFNEHRAKALRFSVTVVDAGGARTHLTLMLGP